MATTRKFESETELQFQRYRDIQRSEEVDGREVIQEKITALEKQLNDPETFPITTNESAGAAD